MIHLVNFLAVHGLLLDVVELITFGKHGNANSENTVKNNCWNVRVVWFT